MIETQQVCREVQIGGVLPIMAYRGRLRPKGIPFSGFRYMKGVGNLSFRFVIGPTGLLRDAVYGHEKVEKMI